MKLHSRLVRDGAEASFVDSFLKKNDLFQDDKLDYIVLKETITDGGIPDIIVVSWDKGKKIKWSKERNKLDKKDLKILHYISSKKSKGIGLKRIKSSLGFSQKTIKTTVERLIKSKLVELKNERVTINLVDDIFFLQDIVAIEAKLKNWKKAIEQAKLNLNFSSKSYVLVPEQKRSSLNTFDEELITGLITYDGNKAKVVKRAKSNKLPSSYYSWLINEHIGRFINGK